ncbi:MAG: DegT/DnrJ/EryC1/StrS family aminotransferase [Desulfobacteraceae bacterium]|nr:MAG: DegT/DnrJ/EryC1/StrS family aminotransferase [Desulfobacteraceae bacterium]
MKKRQIPLCKPAIGLEEIASATDVLKSGWMAHGPKNHEFETLFKDYIGARHAITMNSCTSALHLSIEALGIKGEVIVPSFTFVASVNAILLAGAEPVFVDIDRRTRNVSPEKIREAITQKTEAIMVVHYAGLPADMPKIIELAENHHLRIIEDSAQCIGGRYFGIHPGAYDIGCFSFFPTKNITTGEGGMLTAQDDKIASSIRSICAHGIDSSTHSREKDEKPWLRIASKIGYNFRMSNLLAAIGVEQMKKLHRLNAARRKLSETYIRRLSGLDFIELPIVPEGFDHAWQMFTVLVQPSVRDKLLFYLNSKGVGASVHFDPPVHEQPIYQKLRQGTALAVTRDVSKSIVSLPIYPGMGMDDVDYICDMIQSFS